MKNPNMDRIANEDVLLQMAVSPILFAFIGRQRTVFGLEKRRF
jgi:hypothetical protein